LRPGPKRADFLRQCLDYIADLACSDMFLEDLEHGAGCILGVDGSGLRKVRADPCEEFFTRPDLLRLSGWVPRLVIDAADEHRELVPKLSGLVDRQTIAEAVQHGAQRVIGAVPVGAQHLRDLLEPCIRFVKRFIEHFEAGRAHGRPSEVACHQRSPSYQRVAGAR